LQQLGGVVLLERVVLGLIRRERRCARVGVVPAEVAGCEDDAIGVVRADGKAEGYE